MATDRRINCVVCNSVWVIEYGGRKRVVLGVGCSACRKDTKNPSHLDAQNPSYPERKRPTIVVVETFKGVERWWVAFDADKASNAATGNTRAEAIASYVQRYQLVDVLTPGDLIAAGEPKREAA